MDQVRPVGGVAEGLQPRPIHLGASPRGRLPEPHAVVEVRRGRDEEQVHQSRSQCLGSSRHALAEILGNVTGARQVFERWMNWLPDQQGWLSYIKFELRYNEIERPRAIFERFVLCHPKVGAWIRYAKFEMKNGEVGRARNCYVRAVEKLSDDEEAEQLSVAFAEFEERCKEAERARYIYKFALDHIPKGRAEDLYRKFVAFEKQYGDKEGIEDAIVGKRRFQYEDEVKKNPLNYDSWFDYIRLEESVGNKDRIREVYERAIANVPPAAEKRYWQRYIYLW